MGLNCLLSDPCFPPTWHAVGFRAGFTNFRSELLSFWRLQPTPRLENLGLSLPLLVAVLSLSLALSRWRTVLYVTWAARKLAFWLQRLVWFPHAVDRSNSDVSWLELFWGFIHDTSCLPAFRVGSSWVSVDDDISFGFVLPPVKTLFCTWRC